MGKLIKSKIKLFYGLSILVGLSQALIIYVASSYFKDLSGREDVSIYYLSSYLVVLIALLNLHKFFKRLGKVTVFCFSILAQVISLVVLIFSDSNLLGLISLVAYLISDGLIIVAMDVILESFSSEKEAGRVRGSYMTIFNAGFIIGPLLSTYIISNYDYVGLFGLVLLIKVLVFALALSGLKDFNSHFVQKETVLNLFKKVIKHKNLLRIYYVSFALEFFYAMMIVYSPIYLRELGISWQDIGFIFAFMLVPFLILEYPIGWLADKKWGEKEMIVFFLMWIAITSGSIYFIDSVNIWLWVVVLFATRIAAAALSLLRDSYFYKKIDGKDMDLIDFFRTAMPMSFIIGAVLSALCLMFFPVKGIFVLVMVVSISALVPALSLKDNLSEEEVKHFEAGAKKAYLKN
ncbi:MAG: tetracycline resistance protein [Parcubacteria group bacterium GW2011_GWE2_39_37]|uniref:Tetracycline resistance protein n=1 Tax=Candidatus Falkowbacteria bacterium GW2011_GWF2_39_8 TaxID=1618642 RepID=A0A0G0PYG1_9BACT|nr:MAG: tetracycline resistance protein [Parcubacteria group bacterium GW2011_GWE2_39_37]KKR33174.1 MAG: tetracycline resistance protein [Candidatus Falkowbacteria bacterium GW2011_GWF2_39_8]